MKGKLDPLCLVVAKVSLVASCPPLTQTDRSWIFWVWVCHGCHCVPGHLRTGPASWVQSECCGGGAPSALRSLPTLFLKQSTASSTTPIRQALLPLLFASQAVFQRLGQWRQLIRNLRPIQPLRASCRATPPLSPQLSQKSSVSYPGPGVAT